jgi:hypothetical protein
MPVSQVVSSRFEADRSFSLYLIVWLCLALASLSYIAVALFRPDLVTQARLPGMTVNDPRTARIDASSSQGVVLERGLTEVRTQLSDIQLKVMRGELREQELAARLAVIESRIEELSAAQPQRPVAPPQPTPPAPVAQQPTPAPTARVAAAQPPATQPRPAAVPQVLNRAADADAAEADAAKAQPKQKGTSSVETASVRRDVPPFGSPEVNKAERTAAAAPEQRTEREEPPVGIQLGGAPSLDSLRLNWSILSDRHADALGNLQPRYVTSDALGSTSFNLVAGPIPNRAEAIRVCAKLRNQGVTCRLTAYQGSSL